MKNLLIILALAVSVGFVQTMPRANQIRFTPTGTIASTNVQAAIAEVAIEAGGGGGGTWGSITGTLSDQTDLQSALNGKQSTITFGTGVLTALGVNIGSAGAPVLFNGALGTPVSGVISNTTTATLALGTSSTAPANAAFVQQELDNYTETFSFALSDEITVVNTGQKLSFRMPRARVITGIKFSLATAQASGVAFTIDVRENGTTILSTLYTFDNTEKTTVTAATPGVISDSALADDSEITIHVTQIGDGSGVALKGTFAWH